MIRNTYVLPLGMIVFGFTAARADADGPTLTVNSISMSSSATAVVVVSGSVVGASTFGVNILVEIAPQAGTTGTLEFTPEPPLDIVQAGDPWPGVGIFTPFDTATTFSTILNGSVDDNGSLVPEPVTFTGDLSSFPVVASPGASGVWDLRLTTFVGDSSWEGLTTKLFSGTVTVASGTCSLDIDCDDGIQCTDDSCHPDGFCENLANNAGCTDDGVFCNGQEICDPAVGDPVTGCTSTGPPCPNCDEATGGCDCEPPSVEAMGIRYLRITPQPPGSTLETAIVVTSCGGANPQYVGPLPGQTGLIGFDQDGDGVQESTVGGLVVDPASALWLTPAQWGGSVFVTGLFVTPDTTLDVQTDCGDPSSASLTAPVSITTPVYGDVDGDGSAGLGDVFLIVLGFQNSFEGTTRAMLDLAPCAPDQAINIGDVFFGVLAFQAEPPFLITCADSACAP